MVYFYIAVGKHFSVFVILGCQTPRCPGKNLRRIVTISTSSHAYYSRTTTQRHILARLHNRSS